MNFLYKVILFVSLLVGVPALSYSDNIKAEDILVDTEDLQTIVINVNTDRFIFDNVEDVKRVDVYSIIGAKVASFPVTTEFTEVSLDLSKGYYIIKANKISRKIAVR